MDFDKKLKVLFIGIGGISMSALAVILKEKGYTVLGSDKYDSDAVKDLRDKNIEVYIGHKKEHITSDIDLVVYTSAVHEDNEELKEAKIKGIQCIQRSKLLGYIMQNYNNAINVAGTHGKT
ncbi:MAG: Mur ligase domain-containing protein, partial [Lachnospiraceae bacterium]|nr:Mur ligase domain-containing protein [Lachnospiraceae bacterium]